LKLHPQSAKHCSKQTIIPGTVVEYEQHGKPILAIAQEERSGKWHLLNEEGEELSLASNRLYLYQDSIPEKNKKGLKTLSAMIKDKVVTISVEKIWNTLKSETKTISLETIFSNADLEKTPFNEISLRRAIISDRIYFKRNKEGFTLRTEEEVTNSKSVRTENLKSESEKLALRLAIQKKVMGDKKAILPESISNLEEIAAGSKNSPQIRRYHDLIDDMIKLGGISTKKNAAVEQKAFLLLTHIGHFSPTQNLTPIRLGRPLSFTSEERTDAEKIFQEFKKEGSLEREDYTHLDVFTIDSESTSDFDDAISLERFDNTFRIGIHITDVSHRIPSQSILESASFRRGTSIYCPDETIPMLPPSLSEGVLSLKENSLRPCLSFFLTSDLELTIIKREIILSSIIVKERMSYDQVDRILCDDAPHERSKDLLTLWDFSSQNETKRIEKGALQFTRKDLTPSISSSGKISLVANNDETPARKLISELMVLANETAAQYAHSNNIPFLFRTQEIPDVNIEEASKSIPEGPAREFFKRGFLKRSRTTTAEGPHAGLGLSLYCQITSPIRRALDLVLQRQICTFMKSGIPFYTKETLEQIMDQLTPGLDEANSIQRERNRFWLLSYLNQEKIKELQGIIVRAEPPRPLAEIDSIGATLPFNPRVPLKDKAEDYILGKKVTILIKKADPIQNKLYLDEIEQR
jgi:exoribonuclease II